jgi:hypothetical protein
LAKATLKLLGVYEPWGPAVRQGRLVRANGVEVPVLVRILEDLPADAETLARMREDARLTAHLQHEHVLRVEHASGVGQRCAIVHEGFDGASAARVVQVLRARNQVLPARAAVEIGAAVGIALEEMLRISEGERRLLHPGPTPEEVLVDGAGHVKLAGIRVCGASAPTAHKGYGAPPGGGDAEAATYMVGALLVDLLSGEAPPEGSAEPDKHEAAVRRALIRVLARPGDTPGEAVVAAIRQALSANPGTRGAPGALGRQLRDLALTLQSPGLRAWAPGTVPYVQRAAADVGRGGAPRDGGGSILPLPTDEVDASRRPVPGSGAAGQRVALPEETRAPAASARGLMPIGLAAGQGLPIHAGATIAPFDDEPEPTTRVPRLPADMPAARPAAPSPRPMPAAPTVSPRPSRPENVLPFPPSGPRPGGRPASGIPAAAGPMITQLPADGDVEATVVAVPRQRDEVPISRAADPLAADVCSRGLEPGLVSAVPVGLGGSALDEEPETTSGGAGRLGLAVVLIVALAAGAVMVAGLGWYFFLRVPEVAVPSIPAAGEPTTATSPAEPPEAPAPEPEAAPAAPPSLSPPSPPPPSPAASPASPTPAPATTRAAPAAPAPTSSARASTPAPSASDNGRSAADSTPARITASAASPERVTPTALPPPAAPEPAPAAAPPPVATPAAPEPPSAFKVAFNSGDPTVTLEVKCMNGAGGNGPIVRLADVPRGNCRVTGRGDGVTLQTLVTITQDRAYTCFTGGARSCE